MGNKENKYVKEDSDKFFDETNQDSNDVIQGFKITGFMSSALYLKNVSPIFKDMLITNNSTRRNFGPRDGGSIYCWESKSQFIKVEFSYN